MLQDDLGASSSSVFHEEGAWNGKLIYGPLVEAANLFAGHNGTIVQICGFVMFHGDNYTHYTGNFNCIMIDTGCAAN